MSLYATNNTAKFTARLCAHSLIPIVSQRVIRYAPSFQTPFRLLSTDLTKISNLPCIHTSISQPTQSIRKALISKINTVLPLYREGLQILYPEYDPHLGPICLQGSTLLAALLKHIHHVENITIKGRFSKKMFSIHEHVFLISSIGTKAELVIDPSYKQFFVNRTDLKERVDLLPPVFVGTFEELDKLFIEMLGRNQRTYLQKFFDTLSRDVSYFDGPQVMKKNYVGSNENLNLGDVLCHAFNKLKENHPIPEIADHCYNELVLLRDSINPTDGSIILRGFFGEKEVLINFLTWAKGSLNM